MKFVCFIIVLYCIFAISNAKDKSDEDNANMDPIEAFKVQCM